MDTGSTESLICEELVEKYSFEYAKGISVWTTNAGNFTTRKLAIVNNLRFPQFTIGRKIDGASFHANTNRRKKYKFIFGLDFLIKNQFDFLLSNETISWQGIEVSIHKKNSLIIEKKDVTKSETQLKNNVYKRHTAESVVQHQNAEHVNKD